MNTREGLLAALAAEILAAPSEGGVTRVAVDGVDGAGKTCLADELADRLSGVQVIRASVDSFHNPRAVRYARGQHCPEGFFRDSFDYPLLCRTLLDPLSSGGSGEYRRTAFDHRLDAAALGPLESVRPPAVLLFDGIFTHRPELAGYWDYSIFLDVDRRESLERCLRRDHGPGAVCRVDLADPTLVRYVHGQAIYLATCAPATRATRVVDNTDLARPILVR